jgi:hypothetical protein
MVRTRGFGDRAHGQTRQRLRIEWIYPPAADKAAAFAAADPAVTVVA